MAFALVAIGLILIITGFKDTYAQLGAQLKTDFTGAHSFAAWILAIGAVGALGYVRQLQTFSTLFMTLIIVGLVLSQQGFFQKFSAAWAAGPTTSNANGANASTPSIIPGTNAANPSTWQGLSDYLTNWSVPSVSFSNPFK